MRVCMVAYSFYESDNRVMRYAEALAARGDEVEVLALRREGQSKEGTINGVRVLRIRKRIKDEKIQWSYLLRILIFFFKATILVSVKHLRKPYSLVHVHSVPDFLVFAAWLPRLTGAKVVLDIHDLLPEFYSSKFSSGAQYLSFKLLWLIELVSASFAHHVIAANHIWQIKLIARSVAAPRCSVFLNYPDRSVFQHRGRTRRDDKIVLLYPGTLSRHQGLDTAIRCMEDVKHSEPNAELHIYGEGSAKSSLVQLAHELRLDDTVFFRDVIPLREVASVMENADIGIVPKRNDTFGDEAFSTKILEFMAMSVPVIVSDTTVDRYYFDDKLVVFFESGNAEDLAASIIKLIRDPDARRLQVNNANEFITQNDWSNKKDEYLRLVDGLVISGSSVEGVKKASQVLL
jgi:glycosyltransferase involved in cell wall biosynthesis